MSTARDSRKRTSAKREAPAKAKTEAPPVPVDVDASGPVASIEESIEHTAAAWKPFGGQPEWAPLGSRPSVITGPDGTPVVEGATWAPSADEWLLAHQDNRTPEQKRSQREYDQKLVRLLCVAFDESMATKTADRIDAELTFLGNLCQAFKLPVAPRSGADIEREFWSDARIAAELDRLRQEKEAELRQRAEAQAEREQAEQAHDDELPQRDKLLHDVRTQLGIWSDSAPLDTDDLTYAAFGRPEVLRLWARARALTALWDCPSDAAFPPKPTDDHRQIDGVDTLGRLNDWLILHGAIGQMPPVDARAKAKASSVDHERLGVPDPVKQARGDQFLRWYEAGGITYAGIRDRWNDFHKGDKPVTVSVVNKGIASARRRRRLAEKNEASPLP